MLNGATRLPVGSTRMIALSIFSEHPGTLIFTEMRIYDNLFQTSKKFHHNFL